MWRVARTFTPISCNGRESQAQDWTLTRAEQEQDERDTRSVAMALWVGLGCAEQSRRSRHPGSRLARTQGALRHRQGHRTRGVLPLVTEHASLTAEQLEELDSFHNNHGSFNEEFEARLRRVLGFGGHANPLVYARVASFACRSGQALLFQQPEQSDVAHARIQLYVDDPAVTLSGNETQQQEAIDILVLCRLVLGIPLSWKKGSFTPARHTKVAF